MKTHDVHFRLTEDEKLQLEKKAADAGVSKSTLLRNFISDQPILDKELAERIHALTVEVTRIGSNINQIAHQWNRSGSDHADIEPLILYMADIRRSVKEAENYCYSAHK